MTEDKNTCPHIISSDEGTSYCDLAGKTAEYIADLERRMAEVEKEFASHKKVFDGKKIRGQIDKYFDLYEQSCEDLLEMRELWLDAVGKLLVSKDAHEMVCGQAALSMRENANLRTMLHDANYRLQRLSRKP